MAAAACLVAPAPAGAGLSAFPAERRIEPGMGTQGGAPTLVLEAPREGFAAGQLLVGGTGGPVGWERGSSPELVRRTVLTTVARTRVRGRLVADPLPPLTGAAPRGSVVFVRVSTEGLAAGVYTGALRVGPDAIPVALRVSTWALPPRTAGFRTLFLVQPQAYFAAVDPARPLEAARASNGPLFELLARYRISPGDWGYGTPGPRGYTDGPSWQSRRGSLMREQAELGFSALRVPLSTQRSPASWTGGISPLEPARWAPWLSAVRPFWLRHGFAERAVAWTFDEPGRRHTGLVAAQARALHAGFPEAKLLVTATPGRGNALLRDGGADDIDVWAVLSRRFYGTFRAPRKAERHIRALASATGSGKEVWSYTYHGVPGSPGFDATEPLTGIRLFFVWNALAGTRGTLYADGLARYLGRDPWRSLPGDGQSVFVYPGTRARPEPVSSLRLEAIRDGIQDANLFTAYAARFGRPALVRLTARHGLFAAREGRLLLGCTAGCDLWAPRKFAWPVWQRNERLAARGLERARSTALRALSSPA